ncbi:MAG: hypothetical protein HXS44_17930 [Theionarchaea archaeon]|nr:hypothetical protein [Theionarchaea archaeon]
MYTEKLKESVGGVLGSFVLKNGEIVESDVEEGIQFLVQSILYLEEVVRESKRDLKQVAVSGGKACLCVTFYLDYIVCVKLTPAANTHLLNLMIKRILESAEKELPKKTSSLEEQVPFFDRSKDDVIPNVPVYARQVLEFVDGKRTIRDIIEVSHLPREVVLDVILSYRRSSVLHYRD